MTATPHSRFGGHDDRAQDAQDLADTVDHLRSLLAKLDRHRDGEAFAADIRDRARRQLDELAREARTRLSHLPAPRRTR